MSTEMVMFHLFSPNSLSCCHVTRKEAMDLSNPDTVVGLVKAVAGIGFVALLISFYSIYKYFFSRGQRSPLWLLVLPPVIFAVCIASITVVLPPFVDGALNPVLSTPLPAPSTQAIGKHTPPQQQKTIQQ